MKILTTLLILAGAVLYLNAQTAPASQTTEPEKKAGYDIVVPKRVVQVVPAETTNSDEIIKVQDEKKSEPANSNTKNSNAPAKRVTSQDIKEQELQKKQEEYHRLKGKPE